MDDEFKGLVKKDNTQQGLTGYSDKELDVMKSDLALKKTKHETIAKSVLGVIEIARDLIEIQKINDQATFQIEIMNKKGELIYADLEAFITKEEYKRDTTVGKLKIVKDLLQELNYILKDGDYSDGLKTSLVNLYKTALEKVL